MVEGLKWLGVVARWRSKAAAQRLKMCVASVCCVSLFWTNTSAFQPCQAFQLLIIILILCSSPLIYLIHTLFLHQSLNRLHLTAHLKIPYSEPVADHHTARKAKWHLRLGLEGHKMAAADGPVAKIGPNPVDCSYKGDAATASSVAIATTAIPHLSRARR
jgi:hypothetical protein